MLGKNKDFINNLLNKTSKNMQEYGLLMYAFIIERNYQEAYKVGKEILLKNNNAYLLTLFGDACIGVHKNDEAIKALEKAFELEPTIIDTQYSLYNIYKNTNIDKAKEALNYIKKYNDDNNLEFENKWVSKELSKYL